MRRGRLAGAVVVAVALAPIAGIAQPAPGSVVPQGSPLPRIVPPAAPPVAPGVAAPPAATPSAVPNGDVAVGSVAVDGATAYPPERLNALTDGLTGPATPLAKIEAARVALLNLYRGDGFVLTTVSATVGANGALRFVVTEGYIADVKLEGDIGPAGTQVLAFLNHLTETRPINTRTLERWLLLAQDVPGVSIRAVLRPSGTEPAGLTLVAQVARQAVSGLLTIDNRAFRGTGTAETLTVLDLDSFTQFGEKTELSFYHTEGNTQNFGQASTEFFIGSSGLRGHVYYGYGEATPWLGVVGTAYTGYTTAYGASAIYPLIRTREETLNLSGYLDALDSRTVQTASRGEDKVRALRIAADYALEDLVLGAERPGVNTATVRLSQGLPFLDGSHAGNPMALRGVGAKTDYDFTKLSFDATRTQTLFTPWEDASVAVKVRLTGQATPSVLPSAEAFYLGGPEFDRGYYAGEVSGDNALAGTVELQLNTGFDAPLFGRTISIGTQFYGYFDYGQVWQNVPKTIAAARFISSEGVGVKLTVTRYTEFDLEGVLRNNRLPVGTSGAVKPLKAEALYWRVLTRF